MSEGECDHQFVESQPGLFAGTDGARLCERCERVEVLVEGRWIDFQTYLRRRRSDRPPPLT